MNLRLMIILHAYETGSCLSASNKFKEPVCNRLCLPRVGRERKCPCLDNEESVGNQCRIREETNGGSDSSSVSEDGGAGPILFVVLIPVIAVIIVVIWILYRRRQRAKNEENLESNTDENLIDEKPENKSDEQSNNEQDKNSDQPQTSKEGVDDESAGTSKISQKVNEPSTSQIPQVDGDQRSYRSSRSYYDDRDPRNYGDYRSYSRGFYDDRDPRYSRGYYYNERDSRNYYGDENRYSRNARSYYDTQDPRTRSYYENHGYSSRPFSVEEDPRSPRAFDRNEQGQSKKVSQNINISQVNDASVEVRSDENSNKRGHGKSSKNKKSEKAENRSVHKKNHEAKTVSTVDVLPPPPLIGETHEFQDPLTENDESPKYLDTEKTPIH